MVSTELRKYLQMFVKATPDPQYDAEIWSEMSIVRRCGRGMALRKEKLTEREVHEIIWYLHSINAVPVVTSAGDLRNMLLSGFQEGRDKVVAAERASR